MEKVNLTSKVVMLTNVERQIDEMSTLRKSLLIPDLSKFNYEYPFDVFIHTGTLKTISTFTTEH